MVLLPASVTPARLQALLPALELAVVQVMPLLNETSTCSSAPRPAVSVPLTVCWAVRVTRSVLLAPLSDENTTAPPVVAGALVSSL
ncbi:hypothetical protein DUPY_43880 [Duganella phyllosphaerae]|uniref:Uncharacterized protein n=1 Tax=Duganella phyllosphaerae TaxID=762836 RepID=A0A1E7WCI1_9BURK|nr:hypothetical protein DUPY_43880 [Duganella phyllosphaerae]